MVFVPSSTRVMVAPPSFVTVTAGACAGAGVVAGAGVAEDAAEAGEAGAAGAVDGEAEGVVDAEGDVVAGVLDVGGRAGGGVGSAAAVPAGEALAPLAPPDNACINWGKSLSASVM